MPTPVLVSPDVIDPVELCTVDGNGPIGALLELPLRASRLPPNVTVIGVLPPLKLRTLLTGTPLVHVADELVVNVALPPMWPAPETLRMPPLSAPPLRISPPPETLSVPPLVVVAPEYVKEDGGKLKLAAPLVIELTVTPP